MPRSPFDFDDFFTQDLIGTVDSMKFAENDYGTVQVTVRYRYDEAIAGDDGELHTDTPEFYNVGAGKNWEATAGGSGFAHKSGDPDKRIRSDSAFGAWVLRVLELVGEKDLLSRGDDFYSEAPYLGLRFHLVTEGAGVTKSFPDRTTGEMKTVVTKGKLMPVEYLGGAATSAAAEYDVDAIGLDNATLGDLMTMAAGLPFGEFQGKALSLARDLQNADVRGNLVSALSSQSFYETLKA